MIVRTAGAIATLLIALGGLSTQALGGGSLPVSSVDRPLISGSHSDRWQRRLLHRRIRLRQTVTIHPRSKRLPGVSLRRWGNLATDKPERTQVGGGCS